MCQQDSLIRGGEGVDKIENISTNLQEMHLSSAFPRVAIISNDSKMTCYFSVKLVSFQVTDSILFTSFETLLSLEMMCK